MTKKIQTELSFLMKVSTLFILLIAGGFSNNESYLSLTEKIVSSKKERKLIVANDFDALVEVYKK